MRIQAKSGWRVFFGTTCESTNLTVNLSWELITRKWQLGMGTRYKGKEDGCL